MQRWLATRAGYIGIALALVIGGEQFSIPSLIFVLSALGFAGLDIINKKFVIEETMLSMLFYSALVTASLSLIPAMIYWQTPTLQQIGLLFLLGISANFILFFILKAFSLVDATAVAPYRYLELLISSAVGYIIFDELPTKEIMYGALIIIPATLFIVYSENMSKKKQLEKNET